MALFTGRIEVESNIHFPLIVYHGVRARGMKHALSKLETRAFGLQLVTDLRAAGEWFRVTVFAERA